MSVPTPILQGIYNITKRPDLVAQTTQAALRALNYAHSGSPSPPGTPPQARLPNADYSFDIYETSLPIPIDTSTGTNATSFTLIRPSDFRKMKYAYCDPPTQDTPTPGTYWAWPDNRKMQEISPGGLYDPDTLQTIKDYYYVAGANINFVTCVPRQNLYFGYFKIPDFASSFIVANFPDVIYNKAAAIIFAGNDDNRKTYFETLASDVLMELYTSYFSY